MKRLIGYSLFLFSLGMLTGLFISSILLKTILILILLLIGYNLFVC